MQEQNDIEIFIIDDDADDQEFITLALQRAGFRGRIMSFGNGARLLDHLDANPDRFPSLLVLDLNMPIKDGIATLRELKSKDLLRSIPVMVLTSSARKADEDTCMALGCKYFHNKPINYNAYQELADSAIKYAGENQ